MLREDGLWSQVIASVTTAALGYGVESWQKAQPGNALPVATEMGLFVGGTVGRRIGHHPVWRETMEGIQYGTAWGLGRWTADITPTIGGHGPGVAPPWMPGSSSTTGMVDLNPPAPVDLVTALPPNQPLTTQYQYTRRRVAV